MSNITYEDFKREFSPEDLKVYDTLCKEFLRLVADKGNAELWKIVQTRGTLRIVLDAIHKIRSKYRFLDGVEFFKVWGFNPVTKKIEQMRW